MTLGFSPSSEILTFMAGDFIVTGTCIPNNRWASSQSLMDFDPVDASNAASLGPTETEHQVKLTVAKRTGDYNLYTEALYLEKYRDALLDQAQALQANVDEEVISKSARLAPRVFGWDECNPLVAISKHGGSSIDLTASNADFVFNLLKNMDNQLFQLEDQQVADEFFEELQNMLTYQDLAGIDIDILKRSYPWLVTHSMNVEKPEPVRSINVKRKKNKGAASVPRTEKFINQKKFEAYLSKIETDLQTELNRKFKANPIPESSINAKYAQRYLDTSKLSRRWAIRQPIYAKNVISISKIAWIHLLK